MQLRNSIIQGKAHPSVGIKQRTNKKIKLGMMSAYFRDHTIGRLNIGRAEQLDRDRFELTVIFGSRQEDAMVERFKKAADQFVMLPRDVAGSLRMLSELDLDVLLFADVGMDALCSTLAFSRSAPIQMVTWGHPETTGSAVMDYFVSSRLLESETAAAAYSEKLILLPDLGTYYERPSRSNKPKSRAEFGIPGDRHLYVCPQTLFKFHPEFDWALNEILRRDPLAELVILEGRVPEWTNRLTARWRNLSHLSGDRVRFLPAQSNADFLELLAISDVNLDPFHFGGGNSSYESLAVGTPIVTLPGEFLRSRITTALYKKMGFELLVARDRENFVELAVQLGTDADFRRMCRQHIDKCSPILFQDLAEVRSFENGIQQAVESHS
jgi:protein O-GlcNAc transferase